MSNNTITYQLATQYLSKVALRLEALFATIKEAYKQNHPVMHHYAVKNVIEILKLIEKPELKSRFLKELMRIEHTINKSDIKIDNKLYANLFVQIQFLNHFSGRFGENIHNDLFLQSIRFAQGENGENDLQTPQLLLWLDGGAKRRQDDLKAWLKQLQCLQDTVNLYLDLLRSTAEFDKINMTNGFFHKSLSLKSSCHLILLKMDKLAGIVPKMQLGHHGLSLRLCEVKSMNEIHGTNTEVNLGICQL